MGEGPLEKVHGRRTVREGPMERVRRKRGMSLEEGHSERGLWSKKWL